MSSENEYIENGIYKAIEDLHCKSYTAIWKSYEIKHKYSSSIDMIDMMHDYEVASLYLGFCACRDFPEYLLCSV